VDRDLQEKLMLYKEIVKKISVGVEKKLKQKEYLKKGSFEVIDQGQPLIGGYSNDSSLVVKCDLPVVIFGDHTKCVKFIDFPFIAGADGVKILQAKDGVDSKYLYYYTLLLTKKMVDKGYARHYQFLEKMEVGIPSLSEQKRIVNKIEELFSELDSAVETLKKTKEQLAVYRQSVLKEAFSLRANKNDLGDYIKNIESGKSFKCVETPPQKKEFGIIKVSSVTWGKFNENESKTCKPEQFLESKRVCKGDFLFGRANTLQLIGACVIVDDIEKNLMLSDKILRIHFLSTIKKEYVLFFLRSIMGKKQIQDFSTGNQESMRNIGQDRIRKIQIPVPSLKEQEKIVQDIKSKLSACENIEKTVNDALMQADAMRQSILKKAFDGSL